MLTILSKLAAARVLSGLVTILTIEPNLQTKTVEEDIMFIRNIEYSLIQ